MIPARVACLILALSASAVRANCDGKHCAMAASQSLSILQRSSVEARITPNSELQSSVEVKPTGDNETPSFLARFGPKWLNEAPCVAGNITDPEIEFGVKPPVFKMPTFDVEKGNGICNVMFGELANGDVQVTVMFDDEDRPMKGVTKKWDTARLKISSSVPTDTLYDVARKPIFGRSLDFEHFNILGNASAGLNASAIYFDSSHSGGQGWEGTGHHSWRTIPINDFETDEDGRPIIWINTWNHLFAETNENPDTTMSTISDYPMTLGTRKDADDRFHGITNNAAAGFHNSINPWYEPENDTHGQH